MLYHTGNGMVGAKKIKFSTIEEMATKLGISVSELGRRFGQSASYFSKSAHSKRGSFASVAVQRFFRAIKNDEVLPPAKISVRYENLKDLAYIANVKMSFLAEKLGFASTQSLQYHKEFNCGEILLAMDILDCSLTLLLPSEYNTQTSDVAHIEDNPTTRDTFDEISRILSEMFAQISPKIAEIVSKLDEINAKLPTWRN